MQYINYQHLYYFWRIAMKGSISDAANELRLAQPTLSSQLKTLEQSLGVKLFERSGRTLKLTSSGRTAMRYASQIFSLGEDLIDALEGGEEGASSVVYIGVADVLPKLVMHELLRPLLEDDHPVRVICYENRPERLLAELSIRHIDVVLSDTPLSPTFRMRTYSHLLGECGVSFFAAPELAEKYRENFPKSLAGAPMLIPTENSNLRRSLDHWFNQRDIRPRVVGEFEDSALSKLFARHGHGVFAAASIIEQRVQQETGMLLVGHVDSIRERFYAITMDRNVEKSAVVKIIETAQQGMLFG